jgi:YegS/Rv2252/BmrU family lipid kinase
MFDQLVPNEEFEKEFFFTEFHGHAYLLASEAVEKGADYVIAVGGDGTVNEVAKALVDSQSALGIIPMGSGNGLARDLSIPLDSRKAIDVILEHNIAPIDYCKANENIFFCTCGVGFDARISQRFAEEKHRGSWAYLRSVITEYIKFKPEGYEITLDDSETVRKKAFLVTCANASQYGNNAYIAPLADMNDGLIDVAVLLPMTSLDIVGMVFQMFTKQLNKNPKVKYFKAKKLTVKREKAGIVHLDGEPFSMEKSVTIEVFRSGLRVLVPKNPLPQVYDVPSLFDYLQKRHKKVKL